MEQTTLANSYVKDFILPHKYHPLNFYERFSHTLETENAKTNNNIAGKYLVSLRVTSTPSDVLPV